MSEFRFEVGELVTHRAATGWRGVVTRRDETTECGYVTRRYEVRYCDGSQLVRDWCAECELEPAEPPPPPRSGSVAALLGPRPKPSLAAAN